LPSAFTSLKWGSCRLAAPFSPILCIGAGPAGNGIAQAALAMGASFAVLIDRSATALNIARSQGIGTAIDVSDHSTEETLASLEKLASNGFGTVFDSVGSAATIDLGLSVLGKAGTLVNLAVHDEPMPLNLMRLSGERKMVTSCNFEIGDYAKALAWLEAGRFRVQEWLTPVTLQELPVRFEEIVSNPSEKSVFKMVVDPWK
jgi:threonine dehydrogenase-like Zn-dependent dehydrogenase